MVRSGRGSTREAYDLIRQAIVEGRYAPGQRLVEQRIADELDLSSRTPAREALRMLESDGLVRTEPNRGAVVRSLTVDEIDDFYELRARLEGYAAELAAERAAPEHIDRIDQAIDEFESAIDTAQDQSLAGIRQVNEANQVIHSTILDAARHERLTQLRLRTVDLPLVFEAFRRFRRTELERSNVFHRLVRDAIAAREGTRAARLMSEHILQGRDVLRADLASNPPVTGDDGQWLLRHPSPGVGTG